MHRRGFVDPAARTTLHSPQACVPAINQVARGNRIPKGRFSTAAKTHRRGRLGLGNGRKLGSTEGVKNFRTV